MSGFKDDVIAILRDNVMLHAEAMGLIMEGESWQDSKELLKDLQSRNFPVTDRADKHVFLFDYVVVPLEYAFVNTLLKAFTLVGRMGLIIIDITGKSDMFFKRAVSTFGSFTIHKLTYGDRTYLVIKQGEDYGN